eukprot:scaffold7033_cov257-Pinguiococcus_pyrenoidosus.AAC.30
MVPSALGPNDANKRVSTQQIEIPSVSSPPNALSRKASLALAIAYHSRGAADESLRRQARLLHPPHTPLPTPDTCDITSGDVPASPLGLKWGKARANVRKRVGQLMRRSILLAREPQYRYCAARGKVLRLLGAVPTPTALRAQIGRFDVSAEERREHLCGPHEAAANAGLSGVSGRADVVQASAAGAHRVSGLSVSRGRRLQRSARVAAAAGSGPGAQETEQRTGAYLGYLGRFRNAP